MPVIPTSTIAPATSGSLLSNATGAMSASAAMAAGGDSFFAINKETIGILKPPMSSLLWRFERYVKVDTQSKEGVDPKTQYPSTAKQLDLIRMLDEEFKTLGIASEIGEKGHLTATIPSNLPDGKKAETIALFGHVDTSMDAPGANVKPTTHRNYQGGDIILPGDNSQVITEKDYPELKKCIGMDIITSDGTTLLGADDKAGVAEIMTMADYLVRNPQLKHGEIKLVFTPDEEVGNDLEFFDTKKLGAKFAYTVDAGEAGEVEKETFCAYNIHVAIEGINVHPGYAKGKMVNALKAMAHLISLLPGEQAPENTENKQGYFHINTISGGNVGGINDLFFLIRDFDREELEKRLDLFKGLVAETKKAFPGVNITVDAKNVYNNMVYAFDADSRPIAYAEEAMRQAGVKEIINKPVRGGTTGSKLSLPPHNIPTPNIFAGGMAFHGKREWVPTQWMDMSVYTLLNLAQIWAAEGHEPLLAVDEPGQG